MADCRSRILVCLPTFSWSVFYVKCVGNTSWIGSRLAGAGTGMVGVAAGGFRPPRDPNSGRLQHKALDSAFIKSFMT